jgi:hypothetical protein
MEKVTFWMLNDRPDLSSFLLTDIGGDRKEKRVNERTTVLYGWFIYVYFGLDEHFRSENSSEFNSFQVPLCGCACINLNKDVDNNK